VVQTTEIHHPLIEASLDGYRIAHLSDLHIGSFDKREAGLRWAKLANSLAPDLVVVTGDLVTSGTSFYPAVSDVLAALRAPDGCYVVLGNHDRWDTPSLLEQLRSRGLTVLQNQQTTIGNGRGQWVLAGLDDTEIKRADLKRALPAGSEARFTVLLTHHPKFLERAAERGAHLILCGHTHGGQIGVPFMSDRFNIATSLGQRARGRFEASGTTMLVSAGLGCTGPPIRLGVRPEIGLIVLRSLAHADPIQEPSAVVPA
jgi:predicted MPP superfamily phosphohydrolase